MILFYNFYCLFLFQIRVFTYLLGTPVYASDNLKWMACSNKGSKLLKTEINYWYNCTLTKICTGLKS